MTNRVYICGAGPVGLVSALSLCHAGVPVTVLEAGPTVCTDMRAPAFHAPTVDMLEEFGLLDKLSGVATIEKQMVFSDRMLGKRVELDMDVLGRRYRNPFDLVVGQQWFARMCYELLLEQDCEFLFGHAVTGARNIGAQVEIAATNRSGHVLIHAPWLLGCDGARSVVRTSQNIEFEGYTWPERFLVIHTTHDFTPQYGRVNFIADGPNWQLLVRIPFGPGPDDWLQRVVGGVQADQSDEDALEAPSLQARLQLLSTRQTSYPITNALIYRVHQRVARVFRQGRIALLGDAAHINNPMGAQGLNSGIHDAVNLAPKLAEAWRDDAKHDLLDLYDRQRRITNWNYIQKISVENKARNEETDPAKRIGAVKFMQSLANDEDARFEFLNRWSMGESLDYAASIQ